MLATVLAVLGEANQKALAARFSLGQSLGFQYFDQYTFLGRYLRPMGTQVFPNISHQLMGIIGICLILNSISNCNTHSAQNPFRYG
mgnify:CR=1 FL=1